MENDMKSILVTGGAGFIGANFVPYFAKKYPEYKVINLDKLTYAGNPDNLSDCAECANYKFVQGDICDRALIEKLFAENDIRGVIHFAAESHVDNSITGISCSAGEHHNNPSSPQFRISSAVSAVLSDLISR